MLPAVPLNTCWASQESPVFSLNTKVILRTFNGTSSPPASGLPGENYWLLIGECGTTIEPTNARNRVLVRFDNPVIELGLICHNPVPNSLYILITDLEAHQ